MFLRGSLGFGEEALQSLPGKVGSQDVNDVLSAIDHAINLGLASPSKITAPEKFVAAAAINPRPLEPMPEIAISKHRQKKI
ncbi:hypothetical protein TSUD_13930 [Trifolium subterraneum]|uniref:Uncharacterized protein n=1 Tax=Trifolium subterraneum TaxID=3900 RepID=A0A2Z6P0D1_TRISU|nr:hypothetical protein TSUD_13930 [Trifolium subterraneum]